MSVSYPDQGPLVNFKLHCKNMLKLAVSNISGSYSDPALNPSDRMAKPAFTVMGMKATMLCDGRESS